MREQMLLLPLLLAACAPMTETACRGADWSALGARDGELGLHAQIDQYAARCSGFGVDANQQAYLEAYRYSYGEWARRVNPGEGGM